MIVESFDLLPEVTLTELPTATDVTGMPPIIPKTMFPTPWENSSRLGGETRFCTSSRSIALKVSSVSRDAVTAIVSPMK